jgi:acetyl-CoA acetyltransferase
LKSRKGVTVVDRDDHLRPDDARRAREVAGGVFERRPVTAGNASGIVDGGAAIILASGDAVREKQLKPMSRLVVGGDRRRSAYGHGPGARHASGAEAPA